MSMFTCHARAATLEVNCISKVYIILIVTIVNINLRGWVTSSAAFREIDCKPRIESCCLKLTRSIAY